MLVEDLLTGWARAKGARISELKTTLVPEAQFYEDNRIRKYRGADTKGKKAHNCAADPGLGSRHNQQRRHNSERASNSNYPKRGNG